MDTSHPRELISSLCLLTKHNGVPTKLHQEPTSDEAIREEAEEALPWGDFQSDAGNRDPAQRKFPV